MPHLWIIPWARRYDDPAPYEMRVTRKASRDGGFAVDGELGRLEFKPPCLVKYAPDYGAMPFGGSLVIATYCVPTRPGWVRPLANVLHDSAKPSTGTLAEGALAVFMNFATPPWLGHVLSSVVLHQDAGLLYGQSRNLRGRGYNFAASAPKPVDYDKLAFCPTPADKGVVSFRSWVRQHGGEGIPWQCDDTLPARGTEDIYDMWHAHTKHCSHCLEALRNIEAVRNAGLAIFGVSAIWMPDGAERTAVVLAAAVVAGGAHTLSRLFYRYEFSHADND